MRCFTLDIKLRSYKITLNYFSMLFIHLLCFLSNSITMDSSSIDIYSKDSAFDKFIRPFYKYYPRFLRISRVGEDLNHFL